MQTPNTMLDLSNYSLPVIFLVSAVLIVAAGEVGHWLGRRATDHGGESVATLKAAILGLLALMIGFTFAMAQTRFELRREAVLNEANAIGTTALRARLLPPPHNAQSLELLRDYVKIRLRPSVFLRLGRSMPQSMSRTQFRKLSGSRSGRWRPKPTQWSRRVFSFKP